MQSLQPTEVLSTLEAAGLVLSLTPDHGLKVTPASCLTDTLRAIIRECKPMLVDHLRMTAANDECVGVSTSKLAPEADPDRWCWPHSPAWNSKEIGTFAARLAQLTHKGVNPHAAEQLADKLVIRDRDEDERHSCLECSHLNGHWRCLSWRRANLIADVLSSDWVLRLHRCPGFMEKRE